MAASACNRLLWQVGRPKPLLLLRSWWRPMSSIAATGQAKCKGCGVAMQASAIDAPGFVAPAVLEKFFASTDDASATTGASNDRSAVAVQAPVVDDGTLFALHPELASLEPLSLAGTADAPREPVCKRCVGLANYGKVLPVAMGPGEFREIMAAARVQPAVVLYTVDALDLPGSLHSLFADVFPLARDRLLVVNKVDLLLGDVQTHEQPLRKWIQGLAAAQGTHIPLHNIRLVSASTGYGVHRLLQTVWERCSSAGAHAFVVGSANAGKSSLLNAALAFGRDKEAKATTSPWPGTTLGLIPFELHRDPVQRACVLQRPQVQDGMTQLRALLQSAAAETATATATATAAATATATATSMAPVAAGLALRAPGPQQPVLLVDTPGFQNPDHILHHLTPEELRLASHGSGRLKPQAVTLQPGQTLLCGGLARLDYVEGKGPVYLRLFLPRKVAAHVTRTDNVDELVAAHQGKALLQPPIGGPERMAQLPPLSGHSITLQGDGWETPSWDIVLSNLGWAAATIGFGHRAVFNVSTLGGVGLATRRPFQPLHEKMVAHAQREKRTGGKKLNREKPLSFAEIHELD